MKTTIAITTLVALGAGITSVGALDNANLRGSDTLKELTLDVIDACGVADPDGTAGPLPGLSYLGTGSSNGEQDLLTGAATVSPMSRFLTNGRTCLFPNAAPVAAKDASQAEGLAVALDGLAVMASTANSAACNAGPEDCDASTNPTSGLARTSTINLNGGGTFTFADWREVLRVVYAGMVNADAADLTKRNCNSDVRQSLVSSWGNLFQGGCAGTACTVLQHAFRRDGESGTTDVFVSLLGLPGLNLQTGVDPMCNVTQPVVAGTTPPFFPEYQDNDPIRRNCVGTGNLPLTPGGQPPTAPTEQVCSGNGTLGIVLPINPPPVTTTSPLAYPNTPCARGKFVFGSAPRKSGGAFDRCPNGDSAVFINKCLVPADVANSPQCLNGRNNLPAFKADPVNATAVDGRVYNLHLRRTDGAYQTIRRPGTTAGATVNAEIVGAFYRVHSTRTLNAAPSTDSTCNQDDATQQIGCLVQASPCSIGYAGREAAITVPGVQALKVNGLEPSVACVRNLLTGAPNTYPISRKLYLNSMVGFNASQGKEYELAKCFAKESLVNPLVTSNGFITLGQPVFCEDFAQEGCPAANNHPAASNACANNAVELQAIDN